MCKEKYFCDKINRGEKIAWDYVAVCLIDNKKIFVDLIFALIKFLLLIKFMI